MYQSLLDYWYALEFFEPCYPINEREDCNLTPGQFPWEKIHTDEKVLPNYDIYMGKGVAYDLICWMFTKLGLKKDAEPIERDQTPTCVCALKIDANGQYVPGSFALSSFVWAISRITDAKDLQAPLNFESIQSFQSAIDRELIDQGGTIEMINLENLYEHVCHEIADETMPLQKNYWAKVKRQWRKKDGSFPALEPSTELMGSFYLSDIQRAKSEPTAQLYRYVEALAKKPLKRVEIDTDVSAMQTVLQARFFPKGMWPSIYSPSLMQQVAINLGSEETRTAFSINGPPGTGKTTLLKEIVASNIVERAKLLSQYEHPDDAFHKKTLVNSPDMYNATYYVPNAKLTAYGILVASNNNAAVENISLELPKEIKKGRTTHFTHLENKEDVYFSDVASALTGVSSWGLISARLGKRKHLKEFKERLWWANDGVTLKRYYEEETVPDWTAAKRIFQSAWDTVEQAQMEIEQAQKRILELKNEQTKLQKRQSEMISAQAELERNERALLELQNLLQKMDGTIQLYHQNIITIKSALPFWKQIFRKFLRNDPLIQKWNKEEQCRDELLIEFTRQREKLPRWIETVNAAKTKKSIAQEDFEKQKKVLQKLQADVQKDKDRFGDNFADESFWKDISSNESSQTACPWTDAIYDRLREELFYQALMLQKAFVLNSNCVKQNLQRLFSVWDEKFSSQQRKKIYGSLLNTLFFVVPVISTTFASVQTFLDGIQKEELGLLIVDEAGQATPQSLLGAIWRTRRYIVVGDPLQVEPILTVPKELCKRFADEYGITGPYRSQELSAQILADAGNCFGGWRKINEEKIWLGCPLVVHRRCIQPMFQIFNEIAYNGRMFYRSVEPDSEKAFFMDRSTWYQVEGYEKGRKNHSVLEQTKMAENLLTTAIKKLGGMPSLYIITPFRSVSSDLKETLRSVLKGNTDLSDGEIKDWLDEHCGTIHTFQGKEANEVLLVLGCDSRTGSSAAHWVGKKPNIVNVAVSRAKYRLGVIGDAALWKNIQYVRTLCKYLKE